MRAITIILLTLMLLALLVMLLLGLAFVTAWLTRKVGGPYESDEHKDKTKN